MDPDLNEAWNQLIWAARETGFALTKSCEGKDTTANLTEAKKQAEEALAIINSKLSSQNQQD